MNTRSTSHARGFTLVELLVVIGIIALLIGIALPAFAAIRNRAKVVVCTSNLRQIFTSLQLYASDSRDCWPDQATLGGFGFRVSPGLKQPTWDAFALPEVYGLQATLHGITPGDNLAAMRLPRARYLHSGNGVWVCPAYREDLRSYGATYAFNVADVRDPNDRNPVTANRRKQALNSMWRLRNPTTGFVWDNVNLRPYTSGFFVSPTTPVTGFTITSTSERPYAHRISRLKPLAANFLFVDGHTELRIIE